MSFAALQRSNENASGNDVAAWETYQRRDALQKILVRQQLPEVSWRFLIQARYFEKTAEIAFAAITYAARNASLQHKYLKQQFGKALQKNFIERAHHVL